MNNFCGNCGCKLQSDARFCPECGQKIRTAGNGDSKITEYDENGDLKTAEYDENKEQKEKNDDRKTKCKKHYSKKMQISTNLLSFCCFNV